MTPSAGAARAIAKPPPRPNASPAVSPGHANAGPRGTFGASMETEPEGLLAARLLERAARGTPAHLHVARSEARAARLAAAARALAPKGAGDEAGGGEDGGGEDGGGEDGGDTDRAAPRVVHLPAPDAAAYDRAGPSPANRGARLAALTQIRRSGARPLLLIASPEAALHRLPATPPPPLLLHKGDAAPGDAGLEALGYLADDVADAPGGFARRGAGVLDIFPALAHAAPHRVELDEAGRVASLRRYDPLTQRSRDQVPSLAIPPAREDGAGDLLAVADLLPEGATVTLEAEAADAARVFLRDAADAFRLRLAAGLEEGEAPPREPAALFADALPRGAVLEPREADTPLDAWADLGFLDADDAEQAFLDAAQAARAAGRRVALAGAGVRAKALARALRARFGALPEVAGWRDLCDAPPGFLGWLRRPLLSSFATEGALVVAAAEVLERRADGDDTPALPIQEAALAPGDLVVHEGFGMARLLGLAEVEGADQVRLGFAGGASRLVPADDLARLWRYGAGDGPALDRPDGGTWPARFAEAREALAQAARAALAERAALRARSAPAWKPPRRAYERFCAGFPHDLTPDQALAARDVLRDLASGTPTERLVCGDVGFGKTEIALRAAAAVALAGGQAAVLAPTTVLARQHFEGFRRRFAAVGVAVAMLSRLTPPAEARRVRAALAKGELAVVVGTHAVLAKSVRFARLGLVVADEEQRFGARQKAALRGLAEGGAHLLAMTATPIPRSLQGALLGRQALSVLAVPPARRQPVRTTVAREADALLREALARERRRGGQSFVVVPRVEDLPAMRARLRALVPALRVAEAHGAMPAAEADDAMLRFADGRADALLCTSIVETGLDVPRAGTILVCGAEMFGLSQLHQLRGRVGRGGTRGACFLLARGEPSGAAARRLRALAEEAGLGAGFAIAARDLDQRGAGDLLGEAQAGHVRKLGLALTRHLMERALAEARGRPVPEAAPPVLILPVPARIPASYVPEEALRLSLHARVAHAAGEPGGKSAGEAALDALEDELADRFGAPVPEEVRGLLLRARLRLRARRAGVARLEAGPSAAAATFAGAPPARVAAPLVLRNARVILPAEGRAPGEAAEELLALLAG